MTDKILINPELYVVSRTVINSPIFDSNIKVCISCHHLDEQRDGSMKCVLYNSHPYPDFNCNSFSPRIWWLAKQFNEETFGVR